MTQRKLLNVQRTRRRFRVRNHVKRVSSRPRLSVFRSRANMSAQIIDDESGRTLVSASTLEKAIKSQQKYGGNKDAAKLIGRTIAERAAAAGIKEVAFDRGNYKFHGRVAAVAEGAREAGLSF